MTRRRLDALVALCGAAIVAVVGSSPIALGQEEPASQLTTQAESQPASQPADVPTTSQPMVAETAATDVTTETVQARITQIEAATDLPDTVKTEALSLYRQALDQIALSENWTAQITMFEQGRLEAPALLAQVRERLERAASQPSPAPAVPADASLETLTARLAEADAELKSLQSAAGNLEDETRSRRDRRKLIPELLTTARGRLEKITAELAAPVAPTVSPRLALARRTHLLAQKKATEGEIRAYDEELRFYDVRSEVLAARRDEAQRLVAVAEATKAAWEAAVSERRKADLEQQRRQAELELQQAPRAVRELAERNAALVAEREEVDRQIDAAESKVKEVQGLLEQLTKELTDFRQVVGQTETATLGPMMRRARFKLNELRGYEADLHALKKKHAKAVSTVFEYEQEARESVDARVAAVLEQLREGDAGVNLTRIEPKVRALLEARRPSLEQSKSFFETYASRLGGLVQNEKALVDKIHEFSDFVDKHVLWIPSTGPVYAMRLPTDWQAPVRGWSGIVRALLADARTRFLTHAIALLVIAWLLVARTRFRRRLRELSERVSTASTDSFRHTLAAILWTALLALPWPLLMAYFGRAVAVSVEATGATGLPADMAQALHAGLTAGAWLLLALAFVRQLCRPKGLAEAHFAWDPGATRFARQNLAWVTPIIVPAAVLVIATERYPDAVWRDSIGRIGLIVGLLALIVLVQRLLHPNGKLLAKRLRRGKRGLLFDLRYIWYGLAALVPVAIAGASALGYHYTAIELTQQIAQTLVLVIGVMFAHSLLVRWVFVAQRKIAIQQAKKKRAAALEAKTGERPVAAESPDVVEGALDLASIGEQNRKLLRSLATFGVVVGLWVIWSGMLPALAFMNDVELWQTTVQASGASAESGEGVATATRVGYITLADLAVAVIITLVTFVLARNIPGLLEITLLQKLPLDAGGRFAVSAVARYVITIVGVVLAFGAIGLGWSKVQWLVAAMTVGLGFGLQEIFANFVSGLMLLFERPIRIGDTVTAAGVTGTVTRIRIRATTITDWDRKELVIPNKEFITGQVINWSLSDAILRLTVKVGIAYGSDTDKAEEILYEVAERARHVLEDPKPRVVFAGFGDSSLDFELRVFVPNIDHYINVRHELHRAIDREFRKAGIEIAFPQRDIHVRSIEQALPVVRQPERRPEIEPPSSSSPNE